MSPTSAVRVCKPRPPIEQIARRIWECCLDRGWDLSQLVERSGISRTTLYHLQRSQIARPRISTLSRLAQAFDFPLDQFLWGNGACPTTSSLPRINEEARAFDRRTNTAIQAVSRDRPELFVDWTQTEWDELYSTFGTGGELSPPGVVVEARKINARRESLRKLAVVMETHLHDVARQMVDSLYRMVVPQSNLVASDKLSALIDRHREDPLAESESAQNRAD